MAEGRAGRHAPRPRLGGARRPSCCLRHRYAAEPLVAQRATLLTCHNLAYHGWVPRQSADQLDLPSSVGTSDGVDLLREGILAADLVTTVSPTFARESLRA